MSDDQKTSMKRKKQLKEHVNELSADEVGKTVTEKKKKKRDKEKLPVKPDVEKQDLKHLASEYLKNWKEKRTEWRFQKIRQIWLLQHMYDEKMVPKEYFSILLDYMVDMKGKALETTIEKAEKLVSGDEEESLSGTEKGTISTGDTNSEIICERAKQVIQLLT